MTDATQDNTIRPPTCTQIIQRTLTCNVVGFEDPATGQIAVGLQFVLPPLTPNGRAYFEALGSYLRILAQAIVTGSVTVPMPAPMQKLIDEARNKSQLALALVDQGIADPRPCDEFNGSDVTRTCFDCGWPLTAHAPVELCTSTFGTGMPNEVLRCEMRATPACPTGCVRADVGGRACGPVCVVSQHEHRATVDGHTYRWV